MLFTQQPIFYLIISPFNYKQKNLKVFKKYRYNNMHQKYQGKIPHYLQN